MDLRDFELDFLKLENYKTKTIEKFNKKLIKGNTDVDFLKPLIADHQEYYRTYFQVSIALRKNLDEKFKFIEENFNLLSDWWHTDGIVVFLENSMDFDYAFNKAKEYVKSDLPYVRRLGYVLFIPRLVRDKNNIEKLTTLLKNDDEYHVVMGEAWLISYLAMCDVEKTYDYIKKCDLKYNIIGKAIQKICDSYVISNEDKQRFKNLREERKKIK